MSLNTKENIKELYIEFISKLPGMAHAIDNDGLLIGVSKVWLEKMGYLEEEVLGRSSLDFLTEESREFAVNVVCPRLFKDNRVENISYQFVTKEMATIDVLLSANSIFGPDGEYICSFAIITDISEKNRTEQALKESEDKFKYVFDHSDIGKSITYCNGELHTNAAFRKMLGYTENEIESFFWKDITHPDDVAKSQQLVDSVLSGQRESNSLIKRYIHRDGSVVWADVVTTLRRDADGEPLYLITTITDISERKLREELQKAQVKLVEYGATHTSKELLVAFLDEAEKLTRSTIGFYHFFDEKRNLLSLQTWSSNTVGQMCRVESSVSHYPIEKSGVWADCIRERKPIIHNDYKSLSHKKGVPEGHVDIVRELVVPVIRGEEVVAVLGVGNKENDYNKTDSSVVQELADLGWETVSRKLTEELLYENEKEFRSFFEHNPISSWLEDFSAVKQRFGVLRKSGVSDLDAYLVKHPEELQEFADLIVIHDVNQAALDLHKAKDKEQLLQGLDKTFTVESFAVFKEELISIWCGATHGSHDGMVKTLDGDSRYVQISYRVLPGYEETLEKVLISLVDNTSKWHAKRELLESEARYRMIFDSAQDMLFLHELDAPESPGYFIEVNKIASETLGFSQEEFYALRSSTIISESDFTTISGEQSPLQGASNMMFEKNLVTKDGRLIPVELHANLFEHQGKTLVLSIVRDITERKRLEANLLQAQKMESIGNLAGGIAHDFNNILSAIIGFTELALEAAPEGSSQKDDLDEVYTAGKRAKKLVQQILAFARQSEEEKKPIRFRDVVTEVSHLLRASTPVNIEIRLNIRSAAKVTANTTQLHQAVMNLCTNAIHSLQKNGGSLEIGLRDIHVTTDSQAPGLSVGDYTELTVTDNGPGIESGIIEKIFEPYFTTKGVGEGTGMGLAMVKGIIESYGGDITVNSTPGEETSFIIRLPVATGQKADTVSEIGQDPRGGERVLFVDDEPPIARMGSRILETLGYRVTSRTSSFEALELFKEKPEAFDLVVTDMTMPIMTGDQLAIEIRRIRNDIPIIICTGYSNALNEEGAKRIGVNAFAYKPLTKATLAKTLREVLDL